VWIPFFPSPVKGKARMGRFKLSGDLQVARKGVKQEKMRGMTKELDKQINKA